VSTGRRERSPSVKTTTGIKSYETSGWALGRPHDGNQNQVAVNGRRGGEQSSEAEIGRPWRGFRQRSAEEQSGGGTEAWVAAAINAVRFACPSA
jgi:hypothetical protein